MSHEFKRELLKRVVLPKRDLHKGENGRVLVIGGSKLFHSSIYWSGDVASRIVDLVHFSSPVFENNDLVRRRAKEGFWRGIVVPWSEIDEYIKEDDSVLIGPGMVRDEGLQEGEKPTGEIVNELLSKYVKKRWVVDGGALQEVDVANLGKSVIVTPHRGEFERVFGEKVEDEVEKRLSQVKRLSGRHGGVVILLKGVEDVVSDGERSVVVSGGNEGMTKGGTGDVLAGLVAALYAKSDSYVAATVASYINKRAGERLYEKVGPFFNALELVEEVPRVLWEELRG